MKSRDYMKHLIKSHHFPVLDGPVHSFKVPNPKFSAFAPYHKMNKHFVAQIIRWADSYFALLFIPFSNAVVELPTQADDGHQKVAVTVCILARPPWDEGPNGERYEYRLQIHGKEVSQMPLKSFKCYIY